MTEFQTWLKIRSTLINLRDTKNNIKSSKDQWTARKKERKRKNNSFLWTGEGAIISSRGFNFRCCHDNRNRVRIFENKVLLSSQQVVVVIIVVVVGSKSGSEVITIKREKESQQSDSVDVAKIIKSELGAEIRDRSWVNWAIPFPDFVCSVRPN